jgi:hypothetical protein
MLTNKAKTWIHKKENKIMYMKFLIGSQGEIGRVRIKCDMFIQSVAVDNCNKVRRETITMTGTCRKNG